MLGPIAAAIAQVHDPMASSRVPRPIQVFRPFAQVIAHRETCVDRGLGLSSLNILRLGLAQHHVLG